ncbi:uncharacterized protein LOC108096470 isoform X1 [Drosophila ficusphila]|uniref:uncharacterized protein LOC108096470 isoform X1 n=1 Tax=Drosophila ficusphila TaxID=30025 RepID=UPI001C89CC0D|nr:uncharacterized protein LOC108096470 isoform X1 [Drosophila ficusphila]
MSSCRELLRSTFYRFDVICSATFLVSSTIFITFALNENVRSQKYLKWILSFLIVSYLFDFHIFYGNIFFCILKVELLIFSMFVLVVRTWIPDLVAFYFICLLLVIVALIIGCHLSFSMDLTKSIASLFILSFIFLAISIYFLVAHHFLKAMLPYAYLMFELCVSAVMLMFIMVHAQTIKGDRFIQMNLDDFVLAALLIFHEFLAIYAMTFYWQINNNYFTSEKFLWLSTSTHQYGVTAAITPDYDDYDFKPDLEAWQISNESSFDWAAEEWTIKDK